MNCICLNTIIIVTIFGNRGSNFIKTEIIIYYQKQKQTKRKNKKH